MKREQIISEDELPGLLDGLVCGELDDTTRAHLLAWLEADPLRWRRCGLAFLEAQTWSQALGQWPGGERAYARPGRTVPGAMTAMAGGESPRRARVRAALTAALVLVAFGLGFALRRPADAPRQHAVEPAVRGSAPKPDDGLFHGEGRGDAVAGEPVLASLDVQAGGRFGAPTPIRIPVVPAAADTVEDRTGQHVAQIPEYVRQQWERRGYKVSLERRYVFARLPDGQQVVVPVEQFHVNPVPVSMN
jgi:hypothetical protein